MEEIELFGKASKCQLFQHQVEYLGHLVSNEGGREDHSKVSSMYNRPILKNIKLLQGFLGLTSFYYRFVSHYATIDTPH